MSDFAEKSHICSDRREGHECWKCCWKIWNAGWMRASRMRCAPNGNALSMANGAAPALVGWPDVPVNDAIADSELFIMPAEMNTLPTAIPVRGGVDGVKAILDRSAPDLRAGLGGRVFEMAERYMSIFERYPAIGRRVHLYHPGLQGPMDVCELLWGSSLFVDVIDRPDIVHALLNLITETYIRFMREWDRLAPASSQYAVHWSLLHAGHVMLRDDSAMNFSPAMFREFILPYDQRLLDELGGGAIHFCGKGDHYIEQMSTLRGLTAINMSQTEYNDMETIYRHTIDKGIALLALPRPAAEEALQRGRDLRHRVHRW